jgi:hypothetical protein
MPRDGQHMIFKIWRFLYYDTLCNDFASINILSTIQFVDALDKKVNKVTSECHAYLVCCAAPRRLELERFQSSLLAGSIYDAQA